MTTGVELVVEKEGAKRGHRSGGVGANAQQDDGTLQVCGKQSHGDL